MLFNTRNSAENPLIEELRALMGDVELIYQIREVTYTSKLERIRNIPGRVFNKTLKWIFGPIPSG
jgi:hypothetical protein